MNSAVPLAIFSKFFFGFFVWAYSILFSSIKLAFNFKRKHPITLRCSCIKLFLVCTFLFFFFFSSLNSVSSPFLCRWFKIFVTCASVFLFLFRFFIHLKECFPMSKVFMLQSPLLPRTQNKQRVVFGCMKTKMTWYFYMFLLCRFFFPPFFNNSYIWCVCICSRILSVLIIL